MHHVRSVMIRYGSMKENDFLLKSDPWDSIKAHPWDKDFEVSLYPGPECMLIKLGKHTK